MDPLSLKPSSASVGKPSLAAPGHVTVLAAHMTGMLLIYLLIYTALNSVVKLPTM